jgi:hypothetical protein
MSRSVIRRFILDPFCPKTFHVQSLLTCCVVEVVCARALLVNPRQGFIKIVTFLLYFNPENGFFRLGYLGSYFTKFPLNSLGVGPAALI